METVGETYHFSSLHKDTLFNSFHGNVQCSDDDADVGGPSHRMILCRRDIDQMRHLPEDQWDIAVAALPVYWIFPNVILMPFRFGVFLVRAYPTSGVPGRHLSRVDFYMSPRPLTQPVPKPPRSTSASRTSRKASLRSSSDATNRRSTTTTTPTRENSPPANSGRAGQDWFEPFKQLPSQHRVGARLQMCGLRFV